MKFEIKHRISGSVLFSLETESLRLCVEAAVNAGADLTYANLASADLRGADLTDANLARADLTGANLRGADLARADLAGAYLTDANLRGAKHVIEAGTPDGWRCVGWLQDGWLAIRVGCRNKRLAEGREYWQGKADRSEVLAALDYVESVAKQRGWPTEKP